jgi:hypothetical protein
MSQTIDSIVQCEPVPGTDHLRLTFAGASGTQTFEFTRPALDALIPKLLGQAAAPGSATLAANAITPVGCTPFESLQGLCGLAFNLGESFLHVGVPPNGIAHVRQALDTIELAYRNQQMPRMPG